MIATHVTDFCYLIHKNEILGHFYLAGLFSRFFENKHEI